MNDDLGYMRREAEMLYGKEKFSVSSERYSDVGAAGVVYCIWCGRNLLIFNAVEIVVPAL